jgi:RNA polymerase sigma factor (sigma-70 family)
MPEGAEFEEAFEALFVAAYRVGHRILGNAEEAKDVASEATARALDGWRRVGAMPSPRAWVVRVATNLAIDNVRRRRFSGPASQDARTVSDDNDTSIAVREMLRRLPRRQRDVLALRYLVDLTEVEVAAVLGISQGSVKRHASRALERLRRHDAEGMVTYAV